MQIAIEINRDNFKLCAVNQIMGAKQVIHLIRKDFALDLPEPEVGSLVKKSLQELGIKTETISCILPRYQATVRLIKLPSLIKEELSGMVDIQTVRLIPFPKEEIIYDHQIVAEENNEYSWVKVGIAHRNVINRVLNIVNITGLPIDGIYLSSEASLDWFTSSSGIKEEVFVIANIDDSFLDVEIVYRGIILFSRSISFENSKPDPTIINEEIKKTIIGFKKEEIFMVNSDKFNITQIVLMGLKSISQAIRSSLAADLGLAVSIFEPSNLQTSAQELKENYENGSFCDVLGILFNDRKKLSFIPLEVKAKMSSHRVQRHYLYLGILLFSVLVAAALVLYTRISNKQKTISYLKKQISEQEALVKDIKSAKSRLSVIKEWNSNKKICIDILKELYQITPTEISLTVLTYDVNAPLVLQGSAQKMSDIFKYVSILEQSRYFQNVQIRYATKRKVRNRELTDFQINCPFEKR